MTGASPSRARTVGAAVTGVIAAVMLLVSIVGWWSVAVVFNEEQVADIAVETVTDPTVIDEFARAIVDDALVLLAATDSIGEAEREMLATELAGLLGQPVVSDVVHDIVVVAHRGAMHVLADGELVPGVTIDGDAVVVNLLPLWTAVLELATDLDLPDFVVEGDPSAQLAALEAALNLDLADDAGQVVLFRSDTIEDVGGGVDLVRRIMTAVKQGVLVVSVAALAATAATVLLARHRRRAGAVLAGGVIVGCLVTMALVGRVVGASTSLVSDPALAAVIHGSIDQAGSHLTTALWWSIAVFGVVGVALLVLGGWRTRRAPSAVTTE